MSSDFDMAAGRAYDALARLNGADQQRRDDRLLRDIGRAPLVDVDDAVVEARLDAAWDSSEQWKEKLA
jgi:hypothetical protein